MSRNSTLPIPRTHRYVQTEGMLCRYFTHGEDIRNGPFSPVHIAVWTQLQKGGRYSNCCMIHEWFPPLSQLSDQLDSAREQCHQLEGQLQKKEVALTALNGKVELLTAEAQAKVSFKINIEQNSSPVSNMMDIVLMLCIFCLMCV